jgi:hypothetical protein
MIQPDLDAILTTCEGNQCDAMVLDGYPPLLRTPVGFRMFQSGPVAIHSMAGVVTLGDKLFGRCEYRIDGVGQPPRALFVTRRPSARPEHSVPKGSSTHPTPKIEDLLASFLRLRNCHGLILLDGTSPLLWTDGGILKYRSAHLSAADVASVAKLDDRLLKILLPSSFDASWLRASFEDAGRNSLLVDVFRRSGLCVTYFRGVGEGPASDKGTTGDKGTFSRG